MERKSAPAYFPVKKRGVIKAKSLRQSTSDLRSWLSEIIGLNPQFYQHGEPESELLVCRLIAMFGRGEWLCSGFSGVVWWTLRAGCFTFCVLGAQFSTLFSSPLSLGLWRLQEALAPMGKSWVDSSWSESSATGCQHS